ncbi:MAG: hypothetical protein P9F19_07825 [Candidatus Contendobacter sp.]|nr:hypothetical protein [Candidatus Contendobacter sp.]MDG4557279.1 hypothetical protein [Candidatus Contendobacter sp.]
MLTRSLAKSRTLTNGLGEGWLWLLLLSLLAAPALAANKCVEANGRIFYQDAPCPANARGGDMSLNVNRPFTGQAKPPFAEGAATATTDGTIFPLQNPNARDRPARPSPDAAP